MPVVHVPLNVEVVEDLLLVGVRADLKTGDGERAVVRVVPPAIARTFQRRDADTLLQLEQAGWLPVVVWEHEGMGGAGAAARSPQRRAAGGAWEGVVHARHPCPQLHPTC